MKISYIKNMHLFQLSFVYFHEIEVINILTLLKSSPKIEMSMHILQQTNSIDQQKIGSLQFLETAIFPILWSSLSCSIQITESSLNIDS